MTNLIVANNKNESFKITGNDAEGYMVKHVAGTAWTSFVNNGVATEIIEEAGPFKSVKIASSAALNDMGYYNPRSYYD